MKNTRYFAAKAPDKVFEFFEKHAFDSDGNWRSRGRLLEIMVEITEDRLKELDGE